MRYTDPINKNVKSTETFLMKNKEDYNRVIRLMKKHVASFTCNNVEVLTKRIELIREEKESRIFELYKDTPEMYVNMIQTIYNVKKTVIEENRKMIKDLSELDKDKLEYVYKILQLSKNSSTSRVQQDKYQIDDNHDIDVKILTSVPLCNEPKPTGPKVQTYDANDLTKVKDVYDGITDATRKVMYSSFTSIKKAAVNKTFYMGMRWYLIDRYDPNPMEAKDIGETVATQDRKVDFIVMMNLDKTQVLKIFTKQCDVANHISQSQSAVAQALKYDRSLSGYSLSWWSDVNDELKNAYLKDNELPKRPRNPRGRKLCKVDPNTNEVVITYDSITQACQALNMSSKTVKKAIDTKCTYNGFLWQYLTQ
jgi:hypothetical protein